MAYTDRSYLPVGTHLTYRRGDGAQVTLSIDGQGSPRALGPAPSGQLSHIDPAKLSPDVKLGATPKPKPTSLPFSDGPVFDDPIIGGKFTVFILFYGPVQYHPMHLRCLNGVLGTIPAARMDLRIISNELCRESLELIEQLVADGRCSKHYRHETNRKKYPAMREAFYDPDHPITTNWLIWFDDDSMADIEQHWLQRLGEQIVQFYPSTENYRMFGAKYVWTLQHGQAAKYRTRPWYKGRPFRMHNGRPSPNGNKVIFATGGFWCLHTETMRICGIPDAEIQHNGGDVTIGEQLYQNGFAVRQFNNDKNMVLTSSCPRRGLNEKPFGWHA